MNIEDQGPLLELTGRAIEQVLIDLKSEASNNEVAALWGGSWTGEDIGMWRRQIGAPQIYGKSIGTIELVGDLMASRPGLSDKEIAARVGISEVRAGRIRAELAAK